MQPGTRLDHYEITGKLGEGGMGAVYRAEDTRLKREVAIKVLPPELAMDEERLARLEREAQLLASLNHPNVATIHGFGDVKTDIDGTPQRVTFLVMELVDGESLHSKVAAGPMPWREVVEIGIGIASGLDAAHERGIVHRDLKPANVQVAEDGTVKVLDFGLAKAHAGEANSGTLELSASPTMAAATQSGMILGTAAYMSPEQARGKPVDKRADVWALGCVLYELLAGHKTFEGETVSDVLAAILREEPNLDGLPSIPPSLRHVLERCLEKQPAQRMRDVGDVRIDLEAALTEEPRAAAEKATSGLSVPVAAGIALVAALVGATSVMVWGSTAAPEAHVILSADSIGEGPSPLNVSPDGRWVAELDPQRGIRLRSIGDLAWRDIPGTTNVVVAAFSSDSRTLYMAIGPTPDAPGTIQQITVDGTSPVLVTDVGPGFPVVFRGLDDQMYVSTLDGAAPPNIPFTISRLEPNGALTEIYTGATEGFAAVVGAQVDSTHWLGVSGRGQSIDGIVLIDTASDTVTEILAGYTMPMPLGGGRLLAVDSIGRLVSLEIDLDDGSVVQPPIVRVEGLGITGMNSAGYGISDEGTLVYLAGDVGGAHEEFLSWLYPDGTVERFSERGIEYQVDTFPSPDGTMVAAEFITNAASNEVTIHVHDVARDVSTPLLPGSKSSFPVWSPDSRRIAYYLGDPTAPGIYSAPVDRSELPTLLLAQTESGFPLPIHWSPDGNSLLYVLSGNQFRSATVELNDLWLLPLDGSQPRELVATSAREIEGRFSPDGRWIAYESDATGEPEIYVKAIAGGGEYRISAQGGSEPEWNPRGGQLFFLQGNDIRVVDIDIDGATPSVSPERILVSMAGLLFKQRLYAAWPDGEKFLVAAHNERAATQSVRAIFNWSLWAELE
ncbi:MAG: protein kinase [Acidobacteria bacterium]|nr:protein kinase [Acidobacteriota bacterium]